MEQLRLKCWFADSEEFVAKLVLKEGFRCSIRKIIDPMFIIISRGRFGGEQYDFFGKTEEINRLVEFLENSGFDVEIIRKGKS